MEDSDEIPENWEDEAEEVTQEEAESWIKPQNYIFKTEEELGSHSNEASSLVNLDEQITSHYSKKKEAIKEPTPKKEYVPKPKAEVMIERIDKTNIIAQLTAEGSKFKMPVNIVFIGHVDAGKSTLCGNMILLTNKIEARVVEQYELEAKENNRSSWWLAYIMDVNDEEREKGITIEVGRAFIETPTRTLCILDAPGHKSFVPNMISAAAQADIAALVISAKPGEFESGFQKGGQTTEHILLCRAMGIEKFIILVTKMDLIDWSESRFNHIKSSLLQFLLTTCKLDPENLTWIPISGYQGTNLIRTGDCSWYSGLSFLSALENIEIAAQEFDSPLRIPILDRSKEIGTVAIGKIEAGVIIKGMKVNVMPGSEEAEVQEILGAEDENLAYAGPGMNVRLRLKGCEDYKAGFVICDPYDLPVVSDRFVADVMILDLLPHKPLVLPGYSAIIHIGVCVRECQIDEILFRVDSVTKKKIKGGYVKAQSRAVIRIRLNEAECIAKFSDCRAMGKFALRDEDTTIALGKIIEIS